MELDLRMRGDGGKADFYFVADLNSWDALAGAVVDMPSVSAMLCEGGGVLAIAPGLVKALRLIFST